MLINSKPDVSLDISETIPRFFFDGRALDMMQTAIIGNLCLGA